MAHTTEVLLREHVENLGRCGDVVSVAPGYARNYLLPRRLAIPATADNQRQIVRRATRMAAEEVARLGEITAAVEALSLLTVKTTQRADSGGHLYGSVNAAGVAELVVAAGTKVDEKAVRLAEGPLKTVGEHKVRVHIHGEHFAEITVVVEAEAEPTG
jgi:large subunit ribosomal protein L9